MTSPDAVLTAREVSKTYRTRHALDSVTVEVRRGEMIALIGPSGSGKSTLLRAFSGLTVIDADDGVVMGFGQRLQERGRATSAIRDARRRVGFIFQQFNLVGRLSLFANAALGSLGRIGFWRGLLGLWPAEVSQATMTSLARVGIADYAGQRANTLSGGQQQRGAIARTLVQRAEVILADEPVASLDPVAARRVLQILRDLNQQDGMTVVVTLHQVDYALRYCDRAIALKAGKVAFDGPTAGLDRATLIDIYGPEFQDAFWEGAPA